MKLSDKIEKVSVEVDEGVFSLSCVLHAFADHYVFSADVRDRLSAFIDYLEYVMDTERGLSSSDEVVDTKLVSELYFRRPL